MKRHRLTHLSPAERLKCLSKNKYLIREKKYECPKCPKKFRDRCDVEKHQVTHTGERPFSCSLCDKTFAWADNLNHHLKINHLGEKRSSLSKKSFKCLTCLKIFKYSSDLKMHEKLHTSEKPYKCSKCKKMFQHRKGL